ncbi:MAG: cupin domain-containing protein [Gammaproteobacteria bacterium]|nr:cupin domain-containing protein [Gammaproteobacteria bacterium]
MTTLTIAPAQADGTGEIFTDFSVISARLLEAGVRLERWQAGHELPGDASPEAVLAAYRESVDLLNAHYGFQSVDVVSITPDHPYATAMRGTFLKEHTHADFEVRFFVEGSGLFYLHIDDRVYMVLCGRGDLISIPANTPHWFDMGSSPAFKCIRFFTAPNGWEADFTGSDIATLFPDFDSYTSSLA